MKEQPKMHDRLESIKKNARKALYLNTFIQIIDNNKAIVENCKHIVECNDILVKLLTADFEVHIWGQSLTISDYNKDYVIIRGLISSVELFQKGRAEKNDF